jgi:peroxiredoxin Q/BCP
MASKKKPKTRKKSAAKRTPNIAKKAKAKTRVKTAPKRMARAARQKAPAAVATPKTLPALDVQTTGGAVNLASLKGRNVVIYFYPKDDTPGCTTEGCDIRNNWGVFQGLGTVVLGVSRDDLASHARFKAKFQFPFELIADTDETLCKRFGVMKEKVNYGRTYLGIDRSTFVFDKSGALRKEFRGVKADGHVLDVLAAVKQL